MYRLATINSVTERRTDRQTTIADPTAASSMIG